MISACSQDSDRVLRESIKKELREKKYQKLLRLAVSGLITNPFSVDDDEKSISPVDNIAIRMMILTASVSQHKKNGNAFKEVEKLKYAVYANL